MMINRKSLILLILPVLAACNNKSAHNSATSDSNQTSNTTIQQPKTSNEQVNMAQIAAQDSLFEDGSIPSSWHNAGFDDSVGFKKFIVQFKEWTKTDNIDEIAAHIKFPTKKIATADDFKKQYAQIFNQHVKDIIAKQRLDRISRNQYGAMLGDGLIWFIPSGKGYVLTAINN